MKPVSELPVMKSCCKTCPFRILENGIQYDPHLAAKVMERNLFQSQQICHSTEGRNREAKTRCKGAFDESKTIYTRMGYPDLISEEIRKNPSV